MVNENAKPEASIEYQRPLVEIEDRGIYKYARVVGHETVRLTAAEYERLSQLADFDVQLVGALTAARNIAAEIVRPRLTPIERTEKSLDDIPHSEADRALVWHETGLYFDSIALRVADHLVTMIDIGEGPRWYALSPERSENVTVAVAILRALEAMKSGGTAATFHAFRVGRLIERLYVLQHEPAALIGKKVRSGGALGHEAAHGTAAEIAARHEIYRSDYSAELARCGKKTLAYKRVAIKHGVHPSTIRRVVSG